MIPEHGDSRLTAMVSEGYIHTAEQNGARIYRYKNGFLHSKVIIVDGQTASVGTANLDYRSLCENLEVTTLIYDRRIIAELGKQFEKDKSESLPSEGAERKTSAIGALAEAVVRLLSPLL